MRDLSCDKFVPAATKMMCSNFFTCTTVFDFNTPCDACCIFFWWVRMIPRYAWPSCGSVGATVDSRTHRSHEAFTNETRTLSLKPSDSASHVPSLLRYCHILQSQTCWHCGSTPRKWLCGLRPNRCLIGMQFAFLHHLLALGSSSPEKKWENANTFFVSRVIICFRCLRPGLEQEQARMQQTTFFLSSSILRISGWHQWSWFANVVAASARCNDSARPHVSILSRSRLEVHLVLVSRIFLKGVTLPYPSHSILHSFHLTSFDHFQPHPPTNPSSENFSSPCCMISSSCPRLTDKAICGATSCLGAPKERLKLKHFNSPRTPNVLQHH